MLLQPSLSSNSNSYNPQFENFLIYFLPFLFILYSIYSIWNLYFIILLPWIGYDYNNFILIGVIIILLSILWMNYVKCKFIDPGYIPPELGNKLANIKDITENR